MTRWMYGIALSTAMALAACGGSQSTTASGGNTPAETASGGDTPAPAQADDPHTTFGPLGVGADWKSYTKLNSSPVPSRDHGNRFVDTYVNDAGLEAYKNDGGIPVGTIIVKTSWERDGDQPSDQPGPIFVMEKRAPGFAPEHGDWYYAIHWEDAPERFGGALYWQSPSSKVDYCWECHEGYDRSLGGIPEEFQTW